MFKLNLNSLGIIFLLCSNVWSFSILKLLPLLNILGLHLRNLDLLRRCSVLLKSLLSLQIHKFKKSTINFWLWLYAWCFFFLKFKLTIVKTSCAKGILSHHFSYCEIFFQSKYICRRGVKKSRKTIWGDVD